MFTGIIRHKGHFRELEGKTIRISCPGLATSLTPGDSVAVNGVCLTVAHLDEDGFNADLLDETLAITTLGRLPVEAELNLEPALRLGDSLGGHIISGHVEAVAPVSSIVWKNSGDCELTVTIPSELNDYTVLKGSIAIEGVSLTIQELQGSSLTVKLIPETLAATNLARLKTGDVVNIETDMMVRNVHQSVERILAAKEKDKRTDD